MASVSDPTRVAEQRRQDAIEADRARTRENHERELETLKTSAQEDSAQAKDEYNERLQAEKKSANEEVKRLKEDMYTDRGKKYVKEAIDLSDEREQLATYRQQLEDEYQQRQERMERSTDARVRAVSDGQKDSLEKTLARQKESQRNEIGQLKETIAILSADPRDVEKEKALARTATIKEVAGSEIQKREQLTNAYDRILRRNAEVRSDEQAHSLAKMEEVHLNAQGNTANVLRQQQKDFTVRDKEQREKLYQMEDAYNRSMRNEKMQTNRGVDNIISTQQAMSEKALASQGAAFQKDYSDQNARNQFEISQKANKIEKLKTTSDEFDVSPYLVEKMKNKHETHYYQQLEAERGRNFRQEEAVKNRDASERQVLQRDFNQHIADTKKEGTRSLDFEKRQLYTSYEDLKSQKEKATLSMRQKSSDALQRSESKRAQDLDIQQRKKMEELTLQRESLTDDTRDKVHQAEFQSVVQKRELEGKFSDSRRSQDRKMNEMQDMHELQTKELRLEFESKLRNQERTLGRLATEKGKELDQRLKQQELAFKDKERTLTEHFETEIDKLKRTNALIVAKKS